MLCPPKGYVALKLFAENKLFYFSKRALRRGTTHNMWLKEALISQFLILFRGMGEGGGPSKSTNEFELFSGKNQ